MNSTSAAARGSMYSRRPLLRLSITRIDATRSLSCSTRWEPMKEVPPVTSVFAWVRSILPPGERRVSLERDSLDESRYKPSAIVECSRREVARHEHARPSCQRPVCDSAEYPAERAYGPLRRH